MFIFSLFQQLLYQSANVCVFKLFMSDKLFWLYMSFLFSEKVVEKYQYHNKYRLVKCQSRISYFSVIPHEDWQNRKLQYCDRNFFGGLWIFWENIFKHVDAIDMCVTHKCLYTEICYHGTSNPEIYRYITFNVFFCCRNFTISTFQQHKWWRILNIFSHQRILLFINYN